LSKNVYLNSLKMIFFLYPKTKTRNEEKITKSLEYLIKLTK